MVPNSIEALAGFLASASLGAIWSSCSSEFSELVLIQALPSMPIGFWCDSDGSRYRDTYFAYYPGIWWHGDWCKRTARGSYVIMGRSDAPPNRGGICSGTSDFYRAVEKVDGVLDSFVVDVAQPTSTDDGIMWLFVVKSDDAKEQKIIEQVRRAMYQIKFDSSHPSQKHLMGRNVKYP